jgi:predicted AlkP superfamily pyrophosphatase or phosphodiesterase
VVLLIILSGLIPENAFCQSLQSSRPKLVLVLIADEFPCDYLTRFQDKLTPSGFRRLAESGATFTYCRFQQATNQTACGQSVIATGAHPWATGIVADNWYDRKRGKLVPATFAGDSPQPAVGSSRQLVGTTFGDELKLASSGRSKVFTIATKDSDALILGGKFANNSFFWDSHSGNFVGSSQFNSEVLAKALQSGSAATNVDLGSLRANQMVVDLAKELISHEGLGQDSEPDFLGINFSATELIGNRYGPYSQECQELVVRLDQAIADLLQFLDQKLGLANCLIIFTADHGVAPIPETLRDKGADAGRIDPKYFRSQLNSALATRLGKEDWVEEFEPPNLYLNLNAIDRQQRRQPDVEALTAKLAHSIPGTGEVYSAFQLFLNQVPNGPLTEAVRKSYFWGRSGELFVTPKPGYVFTGENEGTASGSPYSCDAQVPLILHGSMIRAGRYSQAASPADVAATIANILGISAPPLCEGRVLSEALGQSSQTLRPHTAFLDNASLESQ